MLAIVFMSLRTILRRHPFPVVAWFERVVAISFAFPEEVLRPLVPAALQIDSYRGLGFVTVAMVWTKRLRPAGFPAILGQDFFLAGYRVFTRLRDDGRRLRGLYILRSETDKRPMVCVGNLFTRYAYRLVKVQVDGEASTHVETSLPNGERTLALSYATADDSLALPPDSPFPDWHTARLFAGPMPFTFSAESPLTFVVIEASRQDWIPRPVAVADWEVALFNEKPFHGVKPILANAFSTQRIPYRWERGRIVHAGGAT